MKRALLQYNTIINAIRLDYYATSLCWQVKFSIDIHIPYLSTAVFVGYYASLPQMPHCCGLIFSSGCQPQHHLYQVIFVNCSAFVLQFPFCLCLSSHSNTGHWLLLSHITLFYYNFHTAYIWCIVYLHATVSTIFCFMSYQCLSFHHPELDSFLYSLVRH